MSEAPVEVENPFDLTSQVETEGFLAGYVAVVKVIDADGRIMCRLAAHETNNYEAIGMLMQVLDGLRAENAYTTDEYEDEDDE